MIYNKYNSTINTILYANIMREGKRGREGGREMGREEGKRGREGGREMGREERRGMGREEWRGMERRGMENVLGWSWPDLSMAGSTLSWRWRYLKIHMTKHSIIVLL